MQQNHINIVKKKKSVQKSVNTAAHQNNARQKGFKRFGLIFIF
jgi:hypothetical protein